MSDAAAESPKPKPTPPSRPSAMDRLLRPALIPDGRGRFDWQGRLFHAGCLAATWVGLVALAVLMVTVLWKSASWPTEAKAGGAKTVGVAPVAALTAEQQKLRAADRPLDWQFLTSYDSNKSREAGILAGIWGSFWLMLFTGLFSIPTGVGAALYLEEYAKGTWLTRVIQLNIANLAGVPSIVYGILGLTVFARNLGMFGTVPHDYKVGFAGYAISVPIPFGANILTGALTLSLLVLPTVIIATQEALRAVPPSLRHASYALGATRWQTVWHQVLPAAVPGVLTGVILALSRAIGETAPLVMIGIPTYISKCPAEIDSIQKLVTSPGSVLQVPFDRGTAMPLIIFNWVTHPKREFQNVAAAGIMVLMGLLLIMNTLAIVIRQRFQKRIRW